MAREPEAREYINGIPMWAKKKNTLKDIGVFLDWMGRPERSMRIIHVAGTNGKGSVCAFLSSILSEAGYRTAVFSSPHLEDIRERFALNGCPVDERSFQTSFQAVKEIVDQTVARGFCHPTYFEFLFYMGMEMFSRWNTDFVILETGLGGRLDTTNAVERPIACTITSISLDHMEYLGETIPQIACEKAGIIKKGVPVIYDRNNRESEIVIREAAGNACTELFGADRGDYRIIGRFGGGITAVMGTLEGGQAEVFVPFEAEYQVMNALLAVRTAEVLEKKGYCRIKDRHYGAGIRRTVWPGRMEQVLPGVYVDGAHNLGGIEAFAEAARVIAGGRRAYLLFAVVSDKDYTEMISILCDKLHPAGVVNAGMDTYRSAGADVLAKEFRRKAGCPVAHYASVEEAFRCALLEKGENGLLFCCGSLYLAGEIKSLIHNRKEEKHDRF